MTSKQYDQAQVELKNNPKVWLITGVAGFIGSNLLETLLALEQQVVGLDNFSTGCRKNLEDVEARVSKAAWGNFNFIEGDIRDAVTCQNSCAGVELVLHQAALGSIPRSIKDPSTTNAVNVNGFLNIVLAAQSAGVKRIVYASSSSVYGDSTELPKRELNTGKPLSPYAVTKVVNELYAAVLANLHNLELVGLRYFNVFGPRQNPAGPYAAVIPKWIELLSTGQPCTIYGDGQTSRDFCYVANAVQANILAATTTNREAYNKVYNIGCNSRTTLTELYTIIKDALAEKAPHDLPSAPECTDFRPGDVRHSQADITAAEQLLGYQVEYSLKDGMEEMVK